MTQATRKAGRGRALARAAVLTAVVATSTLTGAQAASAGGNGCAWIGYDGDRIKTQHRTGCVSGYYHQDVWSNGRRESTGTYWYNGGIINRYWWTIPDGEGACTEIWYHKPEGGYQSVGLPCEQN
ncbi:hypothetical protein [Kribbella deserti]|uniref:Secreted protein n=1 Tax=Kribbella deserti TaxID=1926257 RepID=A0ABV6QZ20_9ACTN